MSGCGIVAVSHPWWRHFEDLAPTHIFDQHFGMRLFAEGPRGPRLRPGQCFLSRQHSGLSEVKSDSNTFKVNLDVNQFSPNELSVKTVDNTVTIHGKHEEKSDEHGFITREFTRRYVLPEGVEPEQITSALSQGGILTIEAPKKASELPKPVESDEREVPIVKQNAVAVPSQGDRNSQSDQQGNA